MINFSLDVLVLLAILMLNALFVMAEIAIITSKQPKLEELSRKGNRGSRLAMKLSSTPEVFLSTVQVGITFLNILIGLYGGTSIIKGVDNFVAELPVIGEYHQAISYASVMIVVTYFTVLGEVAPKRIAMLYPEKVASIVSHSMIIVTQVLYPFVWLITVSTKAVLYIIRVKKPQTQVSLDEVRFLIQHTEASGMFAATEQDIVKRILHLSNAKVGAIMTPRSKMVCINLHDDSKTNVYKLSAYPFNYFPVINKELNDLIGIVPVKKLLNVRVTNDTLEHIAKKSKILYIPEVAKVSKLIEIFRQKRARIAVVLDEYGDIEGLVTLNDILKILVGDIAIGVPSIQPNIIKQKDGVYHVQGNTLIEEIMTLLNITKLPGEDEHEYRTLASFILKQMLNFPKLGDSFIAVGWRFTVIGMENRRIARVLIEKIIAD
ncbi:MAG: hemolysin family protein [Candidatus Lariskella arthropodorum]